MWPGLVMQPPAVAGRPGWLIAEVGWVRFWGPMPACVGRAGCVITAAADPAAPPLDTAAIFLPLCGNNKQPGAARTAGTPPPFVIRRPPQRPLEVVTIATTSVTNDFIHRNLLWLSWRRESAHYHPGSHDSMVSCRTACLCGIMRNNDTTLHHTCARDLCSRAPLKKSPICGANHQMSSSVSFQHSRTLRFAPSEL